MNRDLRLEVSWRTRREDLDRCATRAAAYLQGLTKIDPALASWSWTDYEHDAAFIHLPLTQAALRGRLELGRFRDDDGGLMEDLGFSIELSDRFDVDRIRMTIHCGSFAAQVPNSVVIDIGSWGEKASVRTLVAMLDHTVDAWDAVDGAVSVGGLGELFPHVQGAMYMGSCMRLPVPPSELPPLPAGVCIEPRGARSSLIVLTEERFDLDDPKHVALARATHTALSEAGLLNLWPAP